MVCWNHIDGVMVWWVSPYESLGDSLRMALTPCRRCCGEFVARQNMYALEANLFVLDRSAGLFHGGLVGGNCVSSIPRNLWVVYPILPKWWIVIRMRAC